MGKHFTRIRKKTRLSAFFTAVIFGIGVGGIVLSALILWQKLAGGDAAWWYLAVSGVAALASLILSFRILMPTDHRLAKRLDEEHSLDEKMRTMVEFRASDDSFMQLQREDADEKLGRTRVSSFRGKQFLAALLVLVIAGGCFTGAVMLPEKTVPGQIEDPMSEFDKQYILADLADLIATVEKSLMTESLKKGTADGLRELVAFVESHDYLSEMKVEAIALVIYINQSVYEVNTAARIGEKLEAGVTPQLQTLGAALKTLAGSKTKGAMDELKKALETQDPAEASFVSDELTSALAQSGTDKADPFVQSVVNFAASLKSYSEGDTQLDACFRGASSELSNAVLIQNINKMTIQTVISRLCTLFEIDPSELAAVEGGENIDTRPPSELQPDQEEDSEIEEPDKEIGSGGMGTGDRIYGSNDVIYNPYTNTYVAYGEILDEYNAKATDMIVDGRVPQDLAAFIEEYFKNLSEYKPE